MERARSTYVNVVFTIALKTIAALLLFVFVEGCGTVTVVPLNVGTEFLPPSPILVPIGIGVYHSEELKQREETVTLSFGARHILPIGDATVRLLSDLYPSLFKEPYSVDGRSALNTNLSKVSGVIEPSIDAFTVDSKPFIGGQQFFVAEITYRFTIYSPAGEVVASWTTRGVGERAGFELNERIVGDAVELAMRDAAERFQTSFLEVPEARRWVHSLPLSDVNAAFLTQRMMKEPDGLWAVYPNVVAGWAGAVQNPEEPTILSVKVRIRNEGQQRLFVRPTDCSISLSGSGVIRPALPSTLAASVMPRLTPGLFPLPLAVLPVTQALAVTNLVGALYEMAATQVEGRYFDKAFARYRSQALRDVTLWHGESVELFLHFVIAGEKVAPQRIDVPVIDLDSATRYIMQLSL